MRSRLLFILLGMALSSCIRFSSSTKFNKREWMEVNDWDHPKRNDMVDDLIKNHILKGLSYKQVISTLGEPANYGDSSIMVYELITDFGSDIDPVYTKNLVIKLNKDSIATEAKIEEWNKGAH